MERDLYLEPEAVAGITSRQRNGVRREADAFFRGLLSSIYKASQRSRDDSDALDGRQAVALTRSFERSVRENPSSGDVAIDFAKLVLSVSGEAATLSEKQRRLISSACVAVRRRPLPALRWSDFVLETLDEPEEIRFVLTACTISKSLLAQRLQEAAKGSWADLGIRDDPRTLAIGYSKTAASVLRGLAAKQPSPLIVFTPELRSTNGRHSQAELFAKELEDAPIEVVAITDDRAIQSLTAGEVDLAVMGSKVMGRDEQGSIEIINSRACVELASLSRKRNVPVLVAIGLYKIWPTEYYLRNKELAVTMEEARGESANDVLRQADIAWVATERACVRSSEFGESDLARLYFGLESLQYPSALTACDDPAMLTEIMENVDKVLAAQLSVEQNSRNREPREIHRETLAYWKTRELPSHFTQANEKFREQLLKDDAWYDRHLDKYVAIKGEDILVDDTPEAVLARAYDTWGYRPIFVSRVVRDSEPARIGPR